MERDAPSHPRAPVTSLTFSNWFHTYIEHIYFYRWKLILFCFEGRSTRPILIYEYWQIFRAPPPGRNRKISQPSSDFFLQILHFSLAGPVLWEYRALHGLNFAVAVSTPRVKQRASAWRKTWSSLFTRKILLEPNTHFREQLWLQVVVTYTSIYCLTFTTLQIGVSEAGFLLQRSLSHTIFVL